MSCESERSGSLDQQRRLPDTGIAANQQHGTAYESASRHPIKFGNTGGQAWGVVRLAGERLQRKKPAFARFAARTTALRAFLTERIPLATSLAFALPAAEGGAAVLAYEGQVAFRHGNRPTLEVRWTLKRP